MRLRSGLFSSTVESAAPSIPRHVAIVMDGNGRWARKRFMPRFFGHKQGVDALVRTVQACADRGIEYLTVFAFSSENWKRPSEEVSGLMNLVLVAVSKYLTKLAMEGVRIRIVGDREAVSDKLREAWRHAESSTAHNQRITLSVAFNYGGRWDVVQACRRAMQAGVPPDELDEARLAQFTAMSYAPDPDLFIRTGGCTSPTASGPTSATPSSMPRCRPMPAASAASVPCRMRSRGPRCRRPTEPTTC
jgi:undecaprenyl diphosphate synthase